MIKRSRRLPADKRQKVSTACDECKRRKFKCDGEVPCNSCDKKGFKCCYSIIDKRSLKGSRMAMGKQKGTGKKSSESETVSETVSEPSEPSETIESETIESETLGPLGPLGPETIGPETIGPETIGPDTIGPDTIGPETIEPLGPLETLEHSKLFHPSTASPSNPPPLEPITNFDKFHQLLTPRTYINHPNICVVNNEIVYNGRTNCNSFLEEINFLHPYLGNVQFPPLDVGQESILVNESDSLHPLPSWSEFQVYLDLFRKKMNDRWNIIDMNDNFYNEIRTIFNKESDNVSLSTHILLYLMLAIGCFNVNEEDHVQKSKPYFLSSLLLLTKKINVEIELSTIQIHFLISFHYKNMGNYGLSYYHLGTAINIGRLIDLQNQSEVTFGGRLFKPIFVADIVCCTDLGRPTLLDVEDGTTISTTIGRHSVFEEPHFTRTDYLVKISRIINKLLHRFYNGQKVINIHHVTDLSIEFKSWAKNLPPKFQITNLEDDDDLFKLHLFNLGGILLLSRPLFLFYILKFFNNQFASGTGLSTTSHHYFYSAIGASIYIIQMLAQFHPSREPLCHNLICQSCAILYMCIKLYQKFNMGNESEIDYYVFNLHQGCNLLPPKQKTIFLDCLSDFTVHQYSPIDFKLINEFQCSFVNQEIAPTLQKHIPFSYDDYDQSVLNKV